MANLIQSFFSEASAKGARSTALHALQWVMAILLASLPILLFAEAPDWLFYVIICAFAAVMVTFLIAYIYLLFKDPDALRSERYSLSKMAIEHGLVGDSLSGLQEPETVEGTTTDSKTLTSDEETKQ